MSEWQPIGTAPTNGSILLLWDGEAVTAGRYDVEAAPFGSPWARLIMPEYHSRIFRPTHWQPLPAPPEGLRAVESEESPG
jgi:hypothetical protein